MFLPESSLKVNVPEDAAIDLYKAMQEFELLGLKCTRQWCSDLLLFCKKELDPLPEAINLTNLFGSEIRTYLRGKSLMDMEEYERAAFFLKDAQSKGCVLLNYYCCYLALSQKSILKNFDVVVSSDDSKQGEMAQLRSRIQKSLPAEDAYSCFIRACVARSLKLTDEAIEYFIKAVHYQPHLWAAWLELAVLVLSRHQLKSLKLPDHWVRSLFYAHCLNELQCPEDALHIYDDLISAAFDSNCSYLQEKRASALWNAKGSSTGAEVAREAYSNLRKTDPYNLDYVDLYSNLLFVVYDRPALSLLAQKCFEVNPYRHQTCCVLGNYYSVIKEHGKAIHYYLQALRNNPYYVFAWTLAGHECMELKSYSSAVMAYRKAIELDPKEYRAWYGLGQTYEIMKMPKYSIFYYMKAHEIRPLDSRFLTALGDVYGKVGNHADSRRCYWKAYCVGDAENIALPRLAMSYRVAGNDEAAVRIYLRFLEDVRPNISAIDQEELCDAVRFLGNYYEKEDDILGLEAVLRWGIEVTKSADYPSLSPVISQLAAATAHDQKRTSEN